jgi:hypothetical protein
MNHPTWASRGLFVFMMPRPGHTARQAAGKPQQERPDYLHEGDVDGPGLPDRPAKTAVWSGRAAGITPRATGRPGLVATRQNTRRRPA